MNEQQSQNPNQQQQPGGLVSMLPAVITGLGAIATSNKWAGPGAAMGRGAMAGLGAYEAGQQKQLTALEQQRIKSLQTRDKFYEEQIKSIEEARTQSQSKVELAEKAEGSSNAILKHVGLSDEDLTGMPPLVKLDLARAGVVAKIKANDRPLQLLKSYQGPDGKPAYAWVDPQTRQIVGTVPKAVADTGSKDPVSQRAAAGASLADAGVPRDQWPKSVADAYTKKFEKSAGAARLLPAGVSGLRQGYDSRLIGINGLPAEEQARLKKQTFGEYVKETQQGVAEAMGTAAPAAQPPSAVQGPTAATGSPSGAQAPMTPEATRTLNGKEYVKVNGQWYDTSGQ